MVHKKINVIIVEDSQAEKEVLVPIKESAEEVDIIGYAPDDDKALRLFEEASSIADSEILNEPGLNHLKELEKKLLQLKLILTINLLQMQIEILKLILDQSDFRQTDNKD